MKDRLWYIIRHTETSHNVLNIKQGHYPSVLNMHGIEQARAIANKLSELEENFDNFKFISSPMLRTRQTIEIIMHILDIKKAPIYEDLIMSKNAGIFENLSRTFIRKHFPDEIEKKAQNYWDYAPPNGESFKEMRQRILKFQEKYTNEKKLIIVLHKSGSSALRRILSDKDQENLTKVTSSHSQNNFYKCNGDKIIKIKTKE